MMDQIDDSYPTSSEIPPGAIRLSEAARRLGVSIGRATEIAKAREAFTGFVIDDDGRLRILVHEGAMRRGVVTAGGGVDAAEIARKVTAKRSQL